MREREPAQATSPAPAGRARGGAARAGSSVVELARAGGNRFTQMLSRQLVLARNGTTGGGTATLADPSSFGLDATGMTEFRNTLSVIGGTATKPFTKDGTKFGNREGRLPAQSDGYYKEWTVKTPGASNRGARRIVTGSGGEYYYSDDHYTTFTRFDPTK